MKSIDFYTLPSTNYNGITPDGACVWAENIENIEINDNFYIPNEFYSIPDKDGVTATEFLYGQTNDLNTYIMQIMSTKHHVENTYSSLENDDLIGYLAFPHDFIEDKKIKKCVHKSKRDILNVKRNYALKSNSYEEYVKWFSGIFPNLLFHEHSWQSIEKLGDFESNIEELHKHLCVLNDYGQKIYFDAEKNEAVALANLGSKYGIICSGKGSNENIEYKEVYKGVKITCNPHTKLHSRYSDQRIYFCWGRDEIENHKIIIVRIGDHWKK